MVIIPQSTCQMSNQVQLAHDNFNLFQESGQVLGYTSTVFITCSTNKYVLCISKKELQDHYQVIFQTKWNLNRNSKHAHEDWNNKT